jgi:hypothetical protein
MAENVTRKQTLATLLASGLNVRDAAQQVGVSERTAYRALRAPGFRRRVTALRGELRERVVGQLTDACTGAVATLRTLLGQSTSSATRLGAARAILEHAGRLTETVELEARLAALESEQKDIRAPKFSAAGRTA